MVRGTMGYITTHTCMYSVLLTDFVQCMRSCFVPLHVNRTEYIRHLLLAIQKFRMTPIVATISPPAATRAAEMENKLNQWDVLNDNYFVSYQNLVKSSIWMRSGMPAVRLF